MPGDVCFLSKDEKDTLRTGGRPGSEGIQLVIMDVPYGSGKTTNTWDTPWTSEHFGKAINVSFEFVQP